MPEKYVTFVSVGTSAVTNEDLYRGIEDPFDGSDHREFLSRCEGNEPLGAVLIDKVQEAHARFWKNPDNYRSDMKNRKRTSAEAISTWLAAKSLTLQLRSGVDKVVLLASGTARGQECMEINRQIFQDYLFKAPSSTDVIPVTLERLNPGDPPMWEVPLGLYDEVAAQVKRYLPRDALGMFNITGSYKGLIPCITHICAQRETSKMFYLHHTMCRYVTLAFRNSFVFESTARTYGA